MFIPIDYKNISKMKKNTIYSLIAIAIIIGGGLLIIHTFFGSFNPFYVVVSGSMIPTINIGDIVIIFEKKVIKTKCDANPYSIPDKDFPIFMENYVGKVEYVIPKIGTISMI